MPRDARVAAAWLCALVCWAAVVPAGAARVDPAAAEHHFNLVGGLPLDRVRA